MSFSVVDEALLQSKLGAACVGTAQPSASNAPSSWPIEAVTMRAGRRRPEHDREVIRIPITPCTVIGSLRAKGISYPEFFPAMTVIVNGGSQRMMGGSMDIYGDMALSL